MVVEVPPGGGRGIVRSVVAVNAQVARGGVDEVVVGAAVAIDVSEAEM